MTDIHVGVLHPVCAFACLQNKVSTIPELDSYFVLLILTLYYLYMIKYRQYSSIIGNSITVIAENIVCHLTITVLLYMYNVCKLKKVYLCLKW